MITIDNLLSGIIGSILGSLLVAIASGLLLYLQVREERRRDTLRRQLETKDLLKSLRAEVEALWERYGDGIGDTIESRSAGAAIKVIFPVYSDFFSIYHACAAKIGTLHDDNLASLIVKSYSQMKGFVDSFRFNNHMIEMYMRLFLLHEQTGQQVYLDQANRVELDLQDYANKLAEGHERYKKQKDILLSALSEAIDRVPV